MITAFNREKYTVDIEIPSVGKKYTNVPLSFLNAYHDFGITIIPPVGQEVLVIDLVDGPVMFLPIIAKRYQGSYQGARPTQSEFGDLYITTPLTRQYNLAKGIIRFEVGELNNESGYAILGYDAEKKVSTTIVKSDVFTFKAPSTQIIFGQTMESDADKVFKVKHTVAQKDIEFTIEQDGIVSLNIADSNQTTELRISNEDCQITTPSAIVSIGETVEITTKNGITITLSPDGALSLEADTINLKANSLNIDANKINIQNQSTVLVGESLDIQNNQTSFNSDECLLDSNTARISSRSIIVDGQLSITGNLTCDARIESLKEILVNGDNVITKNRLKPALNSLYDNLITLSNVFNSHGHLVTVTGALTKSPTPLVSFNVTRPSI